MITSKEELRKWVIDFVSVTNRRAELIEENKKFTSELNSREILMYGKPILEAIANEFGVPFVVRKGEYKDIDGSKRDGYRVTIEGVTFVGISGGCDCMECDFYD